MLVVVLVDVLEGIMGAMKGWRVSWTTNCLFNVRDLVGYGVVLVGVLEHIMGDMIGCVRRCNGRGS